MLTLAKFRLLAVTAIALLFLQSCGGLETVVTVYPDSTASLAYDIQMPLASMPNLEDIGGSFSSMLKKSGSTSDLKATIDSLMKNVVEPKLKAMKQSKRILDYAITDTTDFMQRKTRVELLLGSYRDVGVMHSLLRRQMPALDSIYRTISKRSATDPSDSIAIVDLGDSLELQVHNYLFEPKVPELTREERVARGHRMMDSLLHLMDDSTSFLGMMMRSRPDFDSIKRARNAMTEDQFDSIGTVMSQMTSMMQGLVSPKFRLAAPVILSNNLQEEGFTRVSATMKDGELAIDLAPNFGYSEDSVATEPVRQRFSIRFPSMKVASIDDRARWRNVFHWCDECEEAFEQSLGKTKPKSYGVNFHLMPDSTYLVEVSCGMFETEPAHAYFLLDLYQSMPISAVHTFALGAYVNDPLYKLRHGRPRIRREISDVLVGATTISDRAATITLDRLGAQETFGLSEGSPHFDHGKYRDDRGKWIVLFDEGVTPERPGVYDLCIGGVRVSADLPPYEDDDEQEEDPEHRDNGYRESMLVK
jgi:hypothetical protein